MKKIKEIIVVEGKDDISKVKSAFDCDVIATNGTHFSKNLLKKLKEANEKCGIIVFTDPDYAGEKIRKNINRVVPNCKNAFLSRSLALKGDNIGVENANDKAILEALKNVITASQNIEDRFNISDLIDNGFVSGSNAKERRIMLGDMLKIGYYNAKQLLKALNSFNISREQFNAAVKKINKNDI